MRASCVDIDNGLIRLLTPEHGVRSFIQESDRKFPEEMLLRHMATRERRMLAEDEEADIVRVSFSHRRPLAAAAIKDRTRWHAIDPAAEKDLALLGAYGPGDIEFTGRSYGNRKVTVYFESRCTLSATMRVASMSCSTAKRVLCGRCISSANRSQVSRYSVWSRS